MLFSLFSSLVDIFSFLNVFKYLTVRTGLSMFTSMIVVFIVGTPLINFFSSKQIHNPIRNDGPAEHIVKKNRHPNNGRFDDIVRNFLWSIIMGRSFKSVQLVSDLLVMLQEILFFQNIYKFKNII